MKLYAHKVTKKYFDYGSFLESEEGLCWSAKGNPQETFGFERGNFEALLASKREKMYPVDIVVGEPVERRCDMNPHGLI